MPADFKCPKCKQTSGNDWTQCKGNCPMPMSPHYNPRSIETHRTQTPEDKAEWRKWFGNSR